MPASPPDTPAHPAPAAKGRSTRCQRSATDRHLIRVGAEDCPIRTVSVEAIAELFSDLQCCTDMPGDAGPGGAGAIMEEPLLDRIEGDGVEFHGQLVAPPRSRRRQKLCASRAVFHTVVRR